LVCPDGPERKLAAILSADVVGYSRLMAEDEAATIRTLTSYRKEIHSLVGEHRGRVVDAIGDNILSEFPTALDAVECAVEVQRVLAARNAGLPEDHRMEFRIGVHMGDITAEGERLYGDGVNIAARLEGLAEPGGVYISGEVRGQVERRLDVALEDLGEQEVKNIPRSVRVYRVCLTSEPVTAALDLPGMEERTVPGFHGAPAIAVLPFDNLSGDPDQEYFADGIAEDLITRLSEWRYFPVIARNSAFVYKGQAVDVKRVSRELGIRYLVEGSVRKARNRVRISKLEDIFAVQDEITDAIVGAIHPELLRSERERAVRKDPGSLDAWECVQRGNWHSYRWTKDDNLRARLLYGRAVELDPHLVAGFFGLFMTHWGDFQYQWSESPAQSIDEMRHLAERCVATDDRNAFAHIAVALGHQYAQPHKAIEAARRAVRLNPSLPNAYVVLGSCLMTTGGDPEEVIAYSEKAIRLSPQDALNAEWAAVNMAMAHFAAGRYEEAADCARRGLENRENPFAYRYLAASYARLGRLEEARDAFQEMLRLQPNFSWADWKVVYANADPDYAQRYLDGLRKAGLPEG
jgi:pentatricopeptide repeat protein